MNSRLYICLNDITFVANENGVEKLKRFNAMAKCIRLAGGEVCSVNEKNELIKHDDKSLAFPYIIKNISDIEFDLLVKYHKIRFLTITDFNLVLIETNISIDQVTIQKKLNQFLNPMQEAIPATAGYCNGFTAMLAYALLADLSKQSNAQVTKFFERLFLLCQASSKKLETCAKLFMNYQNSRQALQDGSIGQLKYQRDTACTNSQLRYLYKKSLSSDNVELLERAIDLYEFSNAVIGTQDIKNNLKFNAAQSALERYATLYAPLQLDEYKIHKTYEFTLNLTVNELNEVLCNVLISPNEIFWMSSTNHATLIFNMNDYWFFYNCNESIGSMVITDINNIAKKIHYSMHSNYSEDDYLIFTLNGYAVQNMVQKRPSGPELMESILNARVEKLGKNNIDCNATHKNTLMAYAIQEEQYDAIGCLIRNDATCSNEILYSALHTRNHFLQKAIFENVSSINTLCKFIESLVMVENVQRLFECIGTEKIRNILNYNFHNLHKLIGAYSPRYFSSIYFHILNRIIDKEFLNEMIVRLPQFDIELYYSLFKFTLFNYKKTNCIKIITERLHFHSLNQHFPANDTNVNAAVIHQTKHLYAFAKSRNSFFQTALRKKFPANVSHKLAAHCAEYVGVDFLPESLRASALLG